MRNQERLELVQCTLENKRIISIRRLLECAKRLQQQPMLPFELIDQSGMVLNPCRHSSSSGENACAQRGEQAPTPGPLHMP